VKVMGRNSPRKLKVVADGTGLSSRAGTALLPLVADRLGLRAALSGALAGTRERASRHDPGDVFCDLAVMAADGGRCVSDLVALSSQPTLFGEVASVSTARRVMLSVGGRELERIRRARVRARERAWRLGARPDELVIDIDATLITAHSDKEGAAGNYKGGFGFFPLQASLGREVLAAKLRPGNAGSNTADDHVEVFCEALEQLPADVLDEDILVRSDSAGANHALADACRETGCRFSFGYPIDERVRAAILALPKRAWGPAINQDGERREGASVAELTGQVPLDDWPVGTRLICRRERPHPGAQLSFTDVDGHRFQCFITDQDGSDIARLEQCHREHAGVEDVIQELKETGLRNLPFRDFEPNEAWLELVLTAHQLIVYSETLLFEGEHARYEPKRLRYRLLHVAGKLTRSARTLTLHLPADWPWAGAIAEAFARLCALPAAA